ncbi:MAG: hypothetical protein F6K47_25920 [Symploca sp. SIO2E6]|nr:hypothetical protein [Symploca sp. SIO2E6]
MENQQKIGDVIMNNSDINGIQDEWYTFVAWSWYEGTIFKDQENQEEELKKIFIKSLQNQARYSYVVKGYGDTGNKRNMYQESIKIKKLFFGKNQDIQGLKKVELTLNDVYRQLNDGQNSKFLCNEAIMKKFYVQILTDKFSDYEEAILEPQKFRKEVEKYLNKDRQYVQHVTAIANLAYPPCPIFSKEDTIENLKGWLKIQTEKEIKEKKLHQEISPLPEELYKDYFDKIKGGVVQWSIIVAWSWIEESIYPQTEEKKRCEEEKLKKFFIQSFEEQASYRKLYNRYGDDNAKANMYRESITIKKLFLNKNSEIQELEKVDLTLENIYQKLTGGRTPDSFSYGKFMNMFHVDILTDKFAADVKKIPNPKEFIEGVMKTLNIKEGDQDYQYIKDVKYIANITYPPCPAFGPATFTEHELERWEHGKKKDNTDPNDYMPPSAYIPLSYS